jgi:hypothetical protein
MVNAYLAQIQPLLGSYGLSSQEAALGVGASLGLFLFGFVLGRVTASKNVVVKDVKKTQ